MSAAKLRKNDMVVVLTGEDKGKVAPIIEINYSKQSVILKGINKKTKHHKPSQESQEGRIEKKEFPIHISNVAYMVKKGDANNKNAVSSKVGWNVDKKTGKKQRFLRKIKKNVSGDK